MGDEKEKTAPVQIEELGSSSGLRWIRPASMIENFFDLSQKHNTYITAYWLTINTAQPLQHHHVNTALTHLQRKVPTLRLCMRPGDDGDLWLCERESEEVDFEVIDGADPQAVMEDLMHQSFPSATGPLWRARLVPGGHEEPCPMEELQATFPHTNHIILANHHAIADGTSNMRVCNLFLAILNDVIAGADINDAEQLEMVVSDKEITDLVNEKMTEIEKGNVEELMHELEEGMKKVPLLLQAYPSVCGPKQRTGIMVEVLDNDTTTKFLQKCKKEGASVGSAFTALLHGTAIDLVRDAGICQNQYDMVELHATNLRRYMSGEASTKALGTFISMINNTTQMPAKWRENFWDHARTVHKGVHEKLQENSPIYETAIYQLMFKYESIESFVTDAPPPYADCGTSNMRNLDPLIRGEGDHAQVTRLIRASSNGGSECCLHYLHTFRGRMIYNQAFSSNVIPKEFAKAHTDALFKNLYSLLQ